LDIKYLKSRAWIKLMLRIFEVKTPNLNINSNQKDVFQMVL